MSINYAELEKITRQLKEFVTGSICKKVTQYLKNALVIEFRKKGKEISLLFYIDSKNTFIGLTNFWYDAPKNPYHFTILAKKYLSNLLVKDFYCEYKDRILHIVFEGYEIIAEFLGKNGNIFLLDDSKKILSVLHNRDGEKRLEKAGQQYIPLGSLTQKVFNIREQFANIPENSFIEEITRFYLKKLAIDKIDLEIDSILIEIKRKKEYLEKLEFEYNTSDESIYKETADLIIENLYDYNAIKDKIKIKLIENKSLTENAQYFYEIYKKYQRKKLQLSQYMLSIKEKINLLESKINSLIETKNKVENNLINPFTILKNKNQSKERKEKQLDKESSSLYNILRLENGKRIVYGKSAAGNNEILRKFGKGNFWWFHTRDYQGPFVLLLDKEITFQDIKTAATFAVHFSKGKNAGKVSVIYTRCKYVKPIPTITGKVNYTNEKEIFLSDDSSIIKRIFEINEEGSI
ncbi:MAG: NFACT family protein [Exilispira sp.]